MNSQTKRNITLSNAIQRIDDHMFLAAEAKKWYELYSLTGNKREFVVFKLLISRLSDVLEDRKEIAQ